jgi:hypothetical protein
MYRLITLRNKPIIAIPDASKELSLIAIRRYQPATIKKLLFQLGLRVAVVLHFDQFIGGLIKNPLNFIAGFDFEGWLEYISSEIGEKCNYATVIWPSELYRGRIYVHLMDCQGRQLAFVKISLDQLNDQMLYNEDETIKCLYVKKLKFSYQPKILSLGRFCDYTYLALEPIPESAQPIKPSWDKLTNIIREYAGIAQTIPKTNVQDIDWWPAFCEFAASVPEFMETMENAISKGMKVCRVHGDLGPHNMVLEDRRLWLFDWEHSSKNGPYYTDELSMWLSANQKIILRAPFLAVKRFANKYLKNNSREYSDGIITALGYLAMMKILSAQIIISHWQYPN